MARRVLRLLVKESLDPLVGELNIPPSKYHAHRALLLASLAPGTSRIRGLSEAGHVRHTVTALRKLGTRIRPDGDTFVVEGGPYHPSTREVSVGSSGTTLYFLTGLASLADAPVTIVGQKYFRRRPIRPLLEALSSLGVDLSSPTGCPPIEVSPHPPRGGRATLPGTLSQWISGLLLLAPFATGPSEIVVEGPFNERSYVDLTIRMMAEFGLEVGVADGGRRFEVEGRQEARPACVTLPPDVGAAAFGLAVTALHPADVVFRGLPAASAAEVDHPEAELLDLVQHMGLPLVLDREAGAVRVRHDGIELAPLTVDCRDVPDMLPVLSVLGSFARGTTVLEHVAHVRLKESDRVSAMLQLNAMGGSLEVHGDRLVCTGVERLHGADLSSFNDHRVLMSLAVAGTRAQGETRLTYPNAYRISHPRFLEEMAAIGASMAVELSSHPHTTPRRSTPASRAAGRPWPPSGASGALLTPDEAATTRIEDFVRRWAAERPDDLAVIEVEAAGVPERTWTWAALDREADAVAELLVEWGTTPGEPVAYQLPNWGEFAAVSLGVLRAGAVCCPLMPIYREREMAAMLAQSAARVLFVPGSFRGRDYPAEIVSLCASAAQDLSLAHVVVLRPPARTLPARTLPGASSGSDAVRWHDYAKATAAAAPARHVAGSDQPRSPHERAQLLFTSGTSGAPKGVLHRMDVLNRAAAMQARHLGLTRDDRVFVPSPLAHQTGFLYGMWVAFLLGAPQLLQATWNGRTALGAVRRWGATFVQAATPFLSDLVAAVEDGGGTPESLRIFVATGAAVPRGLAERATRVLGAAVCGAWGTTETCLGSLAAPDDEPAKVWGTDGRALNGVRLRVTDDEGTVLAPGQEGNFEVASPCMFEGYLGHPDWTAAAFTPDGWYRSGDLAVIDESGFVRIMGRVKDVVNRGGEKVPVAEIEGLLLDHPMVHDVAIVAMPDERLGERACAFAVADEGFDLDELRRFCDARRVAKQYWPERLVTVSELPRNPAGKVQKYVLRDWARQLADGGGAGDERAGDERAGDERAGDEQVQSAALKREGSR
jgi:3-phosphoshikimate 1-carboxyvinyltransferase